MNVDDFNIDGSGLDNGNYFGMPFEAEDSAVVLLSVPWEVTTSYGGGTSSAPDVIIGASIQLDFYDKFAPEAWKKGIATLPIDYSIAERSEVRKEDAAKVIKHLKHGGCATDDYLKRKVDRVNNACEELNEEVYLESKRWIDRGKIVGLVGGDHSTPFGLIKALSEKCRQIGILHLDAHRDLRERYEGFEYSHASIMYNVLTKIEGIERLVQVGVRDFCSAEQQLAENDPRVVSFDDDTLMESEFSGEKWIDVCNEIVAHLPQNVYISFDIDVLSPENCPNTGTPVPGGLSYNKALWLIRTVVKSKRNIIGFDLCEVSPESNGEWNANVGARVLYKLVVNAIISNVNK